MELPDAAQGSILEPGAPRLLGVLWAHELGLKVTLSMTVLVMVMVAQGREARMASMWAAVSEVT